MENLYLIWLFDLNTGFYGLPFLDENTNYCP